MAKRQLSASEKEFLVRRYRERHGVGAVRFCQVSGISITSLFAWIKSYDEGGLEGLRSAYYPLRAEVEASGSAMRRKELLQEAGRLRGDLDGMCRGCVQVPVGRGVNTYKSADFEIIESLSAEFPVRDLCQAMGVSRAGYYKWKDR